MPDKVLLTGISGFVAKHVAIELLNSRLQSSPNLFYGAASGISDVDMEANTAPYT